MRETVVIAGEDFTEWDNKARDIIAHLATHPTMPLREDRNMPSARVFINMVLRAQTHLARAGRSAAPEAAFAAWAIVELMGHRQRAGMVREVEMFGGKLLRIDIPTDGGDVTEFYGVASIYALRPCSEEIAREACKGFNDPRPVRPVEYRERKPAPLIGHDEEPQDDEYAA
jgi:hypothetical protein